MHRLKKFRYDCNERWNKILADENPSYLLTKPLIQYYTLFFSVHCLPYKKYFPTGKKSQFKTYLEVETLNESGNAFFLFQSFFLFSG